MRRHAFFKSAAARIKGVAGKKCENGTANFKMGRRNVQHIKKVKFGFLCGVILISTAYMGELLPKFAQLHTHLQKKMQAVTWKLLLIAICE